MSWVMDASIEKLLRWEAVDRVRGEEDGGGDGRGGKGQEWESWLPCLPGFSSFRLKNT